MHNSGTILALFRATDTRIQHDTLTVDPNGVVGDKFYAKNPNRSILITTLHSYELAKKEGITLQFGDLGENIVTDLPLYHLKIGTQIRIGNTPFEISAPCTLCDHLSAIDPVLPMLLAKDRGVFIRALTKGTVSIDDHISIETL